MVARERVSEAKYGADAILSYLEQIEGRMEGAMKADDPEGVHKIRTNSRRLRTALSVFDDIFEGTGVGVGDVKTMMKGLGNARDLDVRIIKIEDWLNTNEGEGIREILKILKEYHSDIREKEQKNVIRSLENAKKKGFLRETHDVSRGLLEQAGKVDHIPYTASLYLRADEEIRKRIERLRKYSRWVHVEEACEKHHKLRIAAKHLRYSLALFSGIFAGKLEKERAALVDLQDAAGEMHDHDVWIEEIRKIIKRIRKGKEEYFKDLEAELERFIEFLEDQRNEEYINFVNAWERLISERILEGLEETLRISRELNGDVKSFAVVSDVHANLDALRAVIEDAKNRGVKWFINAGDIVGYGAFPNEVTDICTGEDFFSITGNIDRDVIDEETAGNDLKAMALSFARHELKRKNIKKLEELPESRMVKVIGTDILIVHGSPDSRDEHLRSSTPENRFRDIADGNPFDVIIFGHTHEQFTRKVGKTLFLNPGSVGRTAERTRHAQYVIIESDPFSFEMINLDYDVRSAVNAIRERDLPEEFVQMILRGNGLKEVQKMEKDLVKATKRIGREDLEKISRKYYWNLEHPRQVRDVALMLFDELKGLHCLGEEERWMLECGSLLHDIGWSMPEVPHHRASMELILNDPDLPFTSRERYMIASIARYHRKALPKEEHFHFRKLDEGDREKVSALASLVRIADGLDCSHSSIVKDLEVNIEKDRVKILCKVNEGPFWEEEKVNDKKKDLFQKVFGKDIVLAWERI